MTSRVTYYRVSVSYAENIKHRPIGRRIFALVETFTSSSQYDAINRLVSLTSPDNSIIRPAYNEANLLERVDVNLQGANALTPLCDRY